MNVDPRMAGENFARVSGARERPVVTVLMPVYNGEPFVGQTVESILRQTWADFEFIIVNDGSTDRTREVVASFGDPRIRLVDNGVNLGLTKSLNRGLALARGEFVARQDSDDLSHPSRLAEQVAFMRSNPAVAVVGTQVRVIDERGHVSRRPGWQRATSDAGIRFQLMFDNAFIHTSVLFRREIVRELLGGYDEGFRTGQDFELWSRVAARYAVANLPRPLVDYRFHNNSTAARYGEEHLELSRAVVAANLRRYLELAHVPDEWTRLISGMHLNHVPVAESELVKLAEVVVEIFDRFVECHPEARADREIRKVLAGKMCQIACRLAGARRGDALATFVRACGFRAGTASSFAGKFFVFLLFGERARALLLRPVARQGQRAL